jgi:hypothetical protein
MTSWKQVELMQSLIQELQIATRLILLMIKSCLQLPTPCIVQFAIQECKIRNWLTICKISQPSLSPPPTFSIMEGSDFGGSHTILKAIEEYK